MTLHEMQVMMGYKPGWDLFAELVFIIALAIGIAFFTLILMFPGEIRRDRKI